MSYGVKEDVRYASIVKKNYMACVLASSDVKARFAMSGYDIQGSNTGTTFYQCLDIPALVVDIWWSLVQFLCLVGSCSTAPGWWDINPQSLDLLVMTRVVYSRPPVRDPYSVIGESSVTSH